MPITFTCTCGKTLRVADEYAGKDGECPTCKKALRIPDADAGQFTAQEPLPHTNVAPWSEPPAARTTPPPLPSDDEVGVDISNISQTLTTHAGGVVSRHDDFFVDAPPEIGRVISMFTTLPKSVQPMAMGVRLGGAFAVGGLSAFVTALIIVAFGGLRMTPELLFFLIVVPAVIGGTFGGLVLWWTSFKHTCTFVGQNGIAMYTCSGSRENISKSEIFLFEDAVELRTGQTRNYYNGGYTGTTYSFIWSDEKNRTVHTLAGRYSSEQGNPVAKDPFHYALMAEFAWTRHLLDDIDKVTANDGLLYFGLKGGDYVQIGEDLLIVVQGGKTLRLRSDQIEKMTMGNGVVCIWEVGAKEGWFVNTGIHQFMYADLANGQFFFRAVEKLLGIRF